MRGRDLEGLPTELRRYVRGLLRNGWDLRGATRTGHIKIVHVASRHTLGVPSSPSDHRSLRNFRQQVQQIERSSAG